MSEKEHQQMNSKIRNRVSTAAGKDPNFWLIKSRLKVRIQKHKSTQFKDFLKIEKAEILACQLAKVPIKSISLKLCWSYGGASSYPS